MTTLTEAQHREEFLLSEANGSLSRETGTLASGESVVDGQTLRLSGGKLYAVDTVDIVTEGLTDFEGIVIGDYDATGGDVTGVPYIARNAEVQDDLITYPSESTEGGEKVATVAAMKAVSIIAR